jgi:hypothetical protein
MACLKATTSAVSGGGLEEGSTIPGRCVGLACVATSTKPGGSEMPGVGTGGNDASSRGQSGCFSALTSAGRLRSHALGPFIVCRLPRETLHRRGSRWSYRTRRGRRGSTASDGRRGRSRVRGFSLHHGFLIPPTKITGREALGELLHWRWQRRRRGSRNGRRSHGWTLGGAPGCALIVVHDPPSLVGRPSPLRRAAIPIP